MINGRGLQLRTLIGVKRLREAGIEPAVTEIGGGLHVQEVEEDEPGGSSAQVVLRLGSYRARLAARQRREGLARPSDQRKGGEEERPVQEGKMREGKGRKWAKEK